MDPFCSLPPSIFLKIINYLPLKDQVRISRVDKKFQHFSSDVVSKTKTLDFSYNNWDFVKLSPLSFTKLINLCSENLESVKLFPDCGESQIEFVKIFSQITFPRLTELDFGYYVEEDDDGTARTYLRSTERDEIFANIIRHVPKLKILRIHRQPAPFPADVVLNNLEELNLDACDDKVMKSLVGRCPNLQVFLLERNRASRGVNANILNEFFASSPKICRFHTGHFAFDDYKETFWQLPLADLNFKSNILRLIDDDRMVKIASAFPNLKNLHVGWVNIKQRGLAALKSLKNLKYLCICPLQLFDFDDEFRFLALECPNLEKLHIRAIISVTTLKMIVQYCPKIQLLDIFSVGEIKTVEDARLVVESLVPLMDINRKVTVRFEGEDAGRIWETCCTEEILANLFGSDDERLIRFEWLGVHNEFNK